MELSCWVSTLDSVLCFAAQFSIFFFLSFLLVRLLLSLFEQGSPSVRPSVRPSASTAAVSLSEGVSVHSNPIHRSRQSVRSQPG
jgi:hypothetical protein